MSKATVPSAAPAPRIHYTVSFPRPADHRVRVEMRIDGVAGKTLDLKMAVWTPGSYLIREFSRHVENVTAKDEAGAALPVEKLDKNTWRVRTGGGKAQAVTVNYSVYAFEPTVRSSFVDDERIALNGASVYLYVDGRAADPVSLKVIPPPAMKKIVTGMAPAARGEFRLADFDRLVDTPVLIGNPWIGEFKVDGKLHQVAVFGEGDYDGPKLAADCEKIVRQGKVLFGALPYERYAFLIELAPRAGGGLEHLSSAHMFLDNFALTRRQSTLDALALISHEYFHTWNVKRLRPLALGPFNYEAENYTRSLWFAEGITDYYADLLLRRAGLMTPEEYFKDLGKTIKGYEETPGRRVQPVAESSLDTWIKFYRADEDSPNTTVSYYVKGKLLGWLLDGELRARSGGKASLDDLMRALYRLVSARGRGYTEAEIREQAAALAPGDWNDFFAKYVDGVAPIDWSGMLKTYGMRANPKAPKTEGLDRPGGALGVKLGAGPLSIKGLTAGGAADRAGLNAGDELIAVNGWRVADEAELSKRLEERKPGDSLELLASRRGRIRPFTVTLAARLPESWEILPVADADGAAKKRYQEYIGADWAPPKPEKAGKPAVPPVKKGKK
jgi:predicted metalloprotease with PDZ domain